jgi:hypothetical protein
LRSKSEPVSPSRKASPGGTAPADRSVERELALGASTTQLLHVARVAPCAQEGSLVFQSRACDRVSGTAKRESEWQRALATRVPFLTASLLSQPEVARRLRRQRGENAPVGAT